MLAAVPGLSFVLSSLLRRRSGPALEHELRTTSHILVGLSQLTGTQLSSNVLRLTSLYLPSFTGDWQLAWQSSCLVCCGRW